MNEKEQTNAKCKSVLTYWNRDDMSTENMRIIVRAILRGGKRPARYERPKN
jgi:hypothetical protein